MQYARRTLSLVLCYATAACLGVSTGCDDRARNLGEAKYYQQQELILEQQNAEWERQIERADTQDKRYEAILAKWEEQIVRVDALLDRWDRILVSLEDRSGDR